MQFGTQYSLLQQRVVDALKKTPVALDYIHTCYALISTPRCGSSMFCDFLKKTGELGTPEEWFNMRRIKAYCQVTGVKDVRFGDYVKEIMSHTASKNGVFGVNFHVDQYMGLKKRGIDIFKYVKFDQIYYLEREDKISQAYSLAKARATDVWSSRVESTPEHIKKIDAIENSQIIGELHRLIRWHEWASANLSRQISRKFIYEQFSRGSACADVKSVFLDCNVDFPEGYAAVPSRKKQSNDKDQGRVDALKKLIDPNKSFSCE